MTIKVTAVYGDLEVPTTEQVELVIYDQIIAMRLMIILTRWRMGLLPSRTYEYYWVRIEVTEEGKAHLIMQDIPIEGLTHFVWELKRGI